MAIPHGYFPASCKSAKLAAAAGANPVCLMMEARVNDAQAFFSQPGVGFFTMLLIGAIAGWIAERVTESNHGIFTNILVGIAGSFVGGKLAEIGEIPVFGFWRTLISASVGAVLLLFAWRMIRGR